MKTATTSLYTIKYFAPYTFANFTCQAPTLAAAQKLKDAHNRENGFSISNREVKTETFGGKKV